MGAHSSSWGSLPPAGEKWGSEVLWLRLVEQTDAGRRREWVRASLGECTGLKVCRGESGG